MDIHRCRFIPYPPSTINALAFSHASAPSQKTPAALRLAIGHENGEIEIWNPNKGLWFQERIFRSGVDRNVEQLVWTQDVIVDDDASEEIRLNEGQLRLFSSGGSTSLTEWDLEKGIPRAHAEGNFGDIWCIAAQPQWNIRSPKQFNATEAAKAPAQLIAAGCADGTIILFSTADEGLRYERTLSQAPRKQSRVISLTWRDRYTVVAGYEEGTIRVIDTRDRKVLRTITLGRGALTNQSLVWAVACLPNGSILSGDSTGELKIWDPRNYSLVQRLKTHDADILDITTSADGRMIYTCGIDRRTVAYALQESQNKNHAPRWQRLAHRRFHQHDVKVMTAYESKDLSVVVSGGIDASPVVLPLRNWNQEYHRKLPHLPQKPPVSVSARSRLMLTWWGKELFIWQIPTSANGEDGETKISDSSNRRLVGQITLMSEDSISSAAVSNTGTMIVVSTSETTKLFQLREHVNRDQTTEVRSRQIELPAGLTRFGAVTVGFSPDSKWVFAVRLSGVLAMAKVTAPSTSSDRPQFHDRVIKLGRSKRSNISNVETALGQYDGTINCGAFSSDSRILAVGDLSGGVEAWVLEGHERDGELEEGAEDSSAGESDDDYSDDETDNAIIHGQKWVRNPAGSQLPHLGSAILAMSFKPSAAMAEAPGPVHGNEGLHATRHNPHPISHEMPSADSGYLVVVTASHKIVEFDVLGCRLSEWSRAHDFSKLPTQFRELKDRTMGMWWDCQASRQRLWLYGFNWLFMFDMAQNIDSTKAKAKTKAKNDGRLQNTKSVADWRGQKRKRQSGAGDEMRQSQKYIATVERTAQTGLMSPVSEGEDSEEAELFLQTREDEGVERATATATSTVTAQEAGPATWHTSQYRSILGACSLTDGITGQTEVVIVERPMHDVALTDRFSNGQEW